MDNWFELKVQIIWKKTRGGFEQNIWITITGAENQWKKEGSLEKLNRLLIVASYHCFNILMIFTLTSWVLWMPLKWLSNSPIPKWGQMNWHCTLFGYEYLIVQINLNMVLKLLLELVVLQYSWKNKNMNNISWAVRMKVYFDSINYSLSIDISFAWRHQINSF